MGQGASARRVLRNFDAPPKLRLKPAPVERFTMLGWGLASLYSMAFWLVLAALLH